MVTWNFALRHSRSIHCCDGGERSIPTKDLGCAEASRIIVRLRVVEAGLSLDILAEANVQYTK